jgi:ATP-binding cassette subfamily B multidrug efflux pump
LLAQLLLRDPDIIILDEPTSALDSHTEKAVMDTIFTLKGDKTVIIVAHRLSTIQRCDRIVVLEQGRVVESGSHNQLLAANGQYAKMFS